MRGVVASGGGRSGGEVVVAIQGEVRRRHEVSHHQPRGE